MMRSRHANRIILLVSPRVTAQLSSSCLRAAALALPPTFAATYSLLCLHVFMLLVRLRAEGNDGADLAQILYEGFQDDVELRVHAEGVKVGGAPDAS